MRGDPIPRSEQALDREPVVRAEVELMRLVVAAADAHVVETVQEGEWADRTGEGGERGERGRREPVGGVNNGFGGGRGSAVSYAFGSFGCVTLVRACFGRGGGVGGGGCGGEGEEDSGVVVQRIGWGLKPRDAEPRRKWGKGGGGPVNRLVQWEGGDGDDGVEMRPRGYQFRGVLRCALAKSRATLGVVSHHLRRPAHLETAAKESPCGSDP